MAKKMLTTIDITEHQAVLQVTSIELDSFGQLKEIKVSIYEYSIEEAAQYLATSVRITDNYHIEGTESFPVKYAKDVVVLFNSTRDMIDINSKYLVEIFDPKSTEDDPKGLELLKKWSEKA